MAPTWRIDELAQRAGVTVDTIRYYAREQLLPPPERAGRHKLYGPEHLDRLTRIRELQAQRFSLAAIRAVLDADRPGLEGSSAATTAGSYSLAELVEESGVEPRARRAAPRGRPAPRPGRVRRARPTTTPTSVCCRPSASCRPIGMTAEILVELGAIYVRHFRALQTRRARHARRARRATTGTRTSSSSIQQQLTANSSRMIPAIDQVLNYVHQRTIQRLTLEAVQTAAETDTGVGGVRVPDDA